MSIPSGCDFSESALVDLVRSATGGSSWEQDARTSVREAKGLLTVTQSRTAHGEIGRFLLKLRQFK
jgi:hypothetical protein